MKIFNISLRSLDDVKEFVTLANACPFDVMVGNSSQRVNGKSFMGLFCLDQRQVHQVFADCGQADFDRFLARVEERFRG